jgi:hypothetical protein
MRSRTLGTTLGLLFLAGCGGGGTDVCDKVATGLNDLITKAAPCSTSTPPSPLTADQCRQSLGNCTDADKQKLGDFGSCLSALPTCSPATVSSWQTSVQDCLLKLQGISSSC